jgi:virginiamycin B lyase
MHRTFILKIVVISVFISTTNLYVFNYNLSLLRQVFAIPVDQTTVVLSSWAVPANSKDILSIVSDFAGSLYFAENNANKIGRLVPATSVITEWSLPNSSSKPNGVAFDVSSGSVYFAENNANKIGRILPDNNTFTEWSLPNSSSRPNGVAFDSDSGSVYFAYNNANKIGRLVPATSVITEWSLPNSSSNIFSITVGFDSTLYFAYNNANKIGEFVPNTNMITEWSLSNSSSRPNGVAFDPSSGSLYFAYNNANKIGRLVPATNTFTEWNITSHPLVIAVNPGGHCFFVDDIGRIGRLG